MSQQYSQIESVPKPFVKWAGGKRQLLSILGKHFPKNYGTYFEPFLGGGAVLFNILYEKPEQKCHVSDLNSDLVLSYITIRDRLDELIVSLKSHAKFYHHDEKSYFYKVRESSPKDQVEKTSRLLFLNRTCFNGLYRVNSKGKFNVPLGKYTNPNIVNEENLRVVSHYLQSKKISIRCQDFSSVLPTSKKGDFVYFDPPYQPVSSTANFTSYTNKDFTYDDLTKLTDVCKELDKKGVYVMLSNSDSNLVEELFSSKPWRTHKIPVNRAINSNASKRTGHYELLITNY